MLWDTIPYMKATLSTIKFPNLKMCFERQIWAPSCTSDIALVNFIITGFYPCICQFIEKEKCKSLYLYRKPIAYLTSSQFLFLMLIQNNFNVSAAYLRILPFDLNSRRTYILKALPFCLFCFF